MNNKDVLDMLKRTYSDNAPDVLQNLDFGKVEKEEVKVIPVRRKYYAAAAIYAAACLVVAIALPFLIGGRGDGPKPTPGQSAHSAETVVSGDNTKQNAESETDAPIMNLTEDGSSNVIDEFMAALEKAINEGRISGTYDRKECVNVTPDDVFEETGARIFKFADSYRTFIYADGEAYEAWQSEDDPGTTGVVPCDFDGNGNKDLLMSTPSNFKRLQTEFYVFNMDTKTSESIGFLLYNLATVARETGGDGETVYPVRDVVYTVDTDNRFMLMPQAGDTLYGYIERENGKPVFVEYESPDETTPERTASNDVYPIPVESAESVTEDVPETVASEITEPESETVAPEVPDPEPEQETEKKPSIAEPMVSSTKYTAPAGTTTPKITTPPVTNRPSNGLEPSVAGYPDPKDSARVHFYKDQAMTDEYATTAEIPYGAKVYYKVEGDPGYICTDFKINVYQLRMDVEYNNYIPVYRPYFINNYNGDGLEYSITAVLAGDSDGNLMYTLTDVTTILRYIAGHTTELHTYGIYGYSEILDYTCDRVVSLHDVTGMLQEIAKWDVERGSIPHYLYGGEVGRNTYLLSVNDPVVLPHGLSLNAIATDGVDYKVYRDVSSISGLSDEIKNKYDDSFFVHYDLVTVYCYTPEGTKPNVEEIKEIWRSRNMLNTRLYPVYSDDNAGDELSEYAICFAVSKTMQVDMNHPL